MSTVAGLFEVEPPEPSKKPPALQVAEETWRRVVPLMAAGRAMRVARDGRNYRLKGQRRVTAELPNQPAAVLIYDNLGRTPLLCFDLDSKRGDVDRDQATITGLLRRAGCGWFSDHSPNGGRHVYVPLAEPAPFHEAAAVTRALTTMAPTLDPQPMLNIHAGCIRPPGARHRSGGHQVLDGPLEDAERALRNPNGPTAWQRLVDELGTPWERPAPSGTSAPAEEEDLAQLDALRGHTEPDATFQNIARTGEYDTTRYATPSEARQGVVWAAVAAGWSFPDLARRLEDGTWPGLASFYARYSPTHRRRAITRDWRRALTFEKRRRESSGSRSVRVRTTSPLKSQAGGREGAPQQVNREIRAWLTAVDLLHGPETDLAMRIVLYALAEAAVLTDSLNVEHGNRSLAIASGLDHTTVGRCLKKLLDEPSDRSLLDLVRPAQGVRANTYELKIPALLRAACQAKRWRSGRIHALRPAFRELGRPAAFVYAALEQLNTPAGGRDIAALARIGVTATYEALAALSAWGLATKTNRGWTLGTANLGQLAEAWGITDAVREQVARYRAERRAWHQWLIDHGLLSPVALAPEPPSMPPPEPEPPPPQDESMLELLGRVLGAVPLTA